MQIHTDNADLFMKIETGSSTVMSIRIRPFYL